MDSNIVSSLKSIQKLTPVLKDVNANHEMCGMDVFLLQKRDESVCGLIYRICNDLKSAYIHLRVGGHHQKS